MNEAVWGANLTSEMVNVTEFGLNVVDAPAPSVATTMTVYVQVEENDVCRWEPREFLGSFSVEDAP